MKAVTQVLPDIPTQFDSSFLDWFRARTESAWAALPDFTPEDMLATYVAGGAGGCAWRHGSRWLNGLTEDQVAHIEQAHRVLFPPDYRLFVRSLHTVDLPMLCAGYLDAGLRLEDQQGVLASAYLEQYEQYMVLEEGASFHHWLTDTHGTGVQPAALWQGIQFDVEYNDLWLTDWGIRPTSLEARNERVRRLVEAAPKLIHVFGSRYLLAEPAAMGNPVFSIDQSDVVIYGANLRDYLLFEFADLLGLPRPSVEQVITQAIHARRDEYAAIPFWGHLCAL